MNPRRPSRRPQDNQSQSHSRSQALQVRDYEQDPVQLSDQGSGQNLDDNMSRDYEQIAELDQYEDDGVDDDEISDNPQARRRAEERMELRDKERRQRQGVIIQGPNVQDFFEEDIEYNLGNRRNIFFEDDEETEQEIDERRYLNAEEVRGKLIEWIQEEQTVKYIRYKFKKFINTFRGSHNFPVYASALRDMCVENRQSLQISYNDIKNVNPTIATWIAFEPLVIFPYLNRCAYSMAIKQYPSYENIHPEVFVKVRDLPVVDSLRELRHIHLNKMVNLIGVITKRNQVLNQLKKILCRCQRCGESVGPFYATSMSQINLGSCTSCQSKGPFFIDKERTVYRNHQTITVQELPHDVPPGRIPRQKDVILLGDNIQVARPGDAVQIIGVYMNRYCVNLNIKQGFPVFNTVIEANYIRRTEDAEFKDDESSKELEEEFKKLARSPTLEKDIMNSIAPSIFGHEHIKKALTFALFGGVEKLIEGTHRIRGDINVLILGDPGTAKSQFLKSVQKVFARCIYTTGKGASGVGLTASVKRDFTTGDWMLEAGALVLADKGICLIDEFDKMNEVDRTSIHEAMQQQSISISKAGIVASLRARCSVIAAANPISGTYRPDKSFKDNVDLSDPILSRFDVLCVVKDEVDSELDHCLSTFVLNSHIKNHPLNQQLNKLNQAQNAEIYKIEMMQEPDTRRPIDINFLKNYIKYAREKCHPNLSIENSELLKQFYVQLREESLRSGGLHIAVRHIESLVRMATARAKMHLRTEVKREDVQEAIKVMLESFVQSQKYSVAKQVQARLRKYTGEL